MNIEWHANLCSELLGVIVLLYPFCRIKVGFSRSAIYLASSSWPLENCKGYIPFYLGKVGWKGGRGKCEESVWGTIWLTYIMWKQIPIKCFIKMNVMYTEMLCKVRFMRAIITCNLYNSLPLSFVILISHFVLILLTWVIGNFLTCSQGKKVD